MAGSNLKHVRPEFDSSAPESTNDKHLREKMIYLLAILHQPITPKSLSFQVLVD
jgi:hypothetical protein